MLADNAFGEAGHCVVIEEFLVGEEASFIVIADGQNILPLATSQDHKAMGDGDTGPNTGGMGAYSPAPVVDDAMHRRVMDEVIRPTIEGMAADGSPFTGFLYAGLMISPEGKSPGAGIQCPLRRSRNPADTDAACSPIFLNFAWPRSGDVSTANRRSGTRAPAWAW